MGATLPGSQYSRLFRNLNRRVLGFNLDLTNLCNDNFWPWQLNRPSHLGWILFCRGAMSYRDFYDWRLPSEIEWEKATRCVDSRPYPWGDSIERNNANYYSSHDIFEKIAGGLGDTTPVGFYNGQTYEDYETLDSPSPYGLYDMAGNVWQWTGDVYEDQHYRYMHGGAKDNYAYNLRVWTRNSAGPEHYGPNIGFRCGRDT